MRTEHRNIERKNIVHGCVAHSKESEEGRKIIKIDCRFLVVRDGYDVQCLIKILNLENTGIKEMKIVKVDHGILSVTNNKMVCDTVQYHARVFQISKI